jgi:hypothetical protein
MEIEKINDGLANYVNLVGSEIDPTANYVLGKDCAPDIYNWWANGGLSEKIVKFWPDCIGTGIKISVAAQRDSTRNKQSTQKLQDWLQGEFDRLDVLGTFIEAEIQCGVDCAAPIIILTDGRDNLDQPINNSRYGRVEMLQIQDPQYFRPNIGSMFGHKSVDHRLVEYYSNYIGTNSSIHQSRVLPLAARKLLRSEKWVTVKEREWGRQLIGSAVINAAIRYEAAITVASILIEKKNMLVYGIKDFNEGMAGSSSDAFSARAVDQVRKLQRASNILNVALVDLDNSKLESLDRNISGVSDLIEKSRQFLLANIDNIPAEFLFGERNHGGLSGSNDDLERNNNESNRRFINRWLPHLNKLVLLLLNSDGCPIKNVDPSSIEIGRESSYVENPGDTAATRLTLLQGDELLVNLGAISPKEMRSRHVGASFERELVLESSEVPQRESKVKPTSTTQTQTENSSINPNPSVGRGRDDGKAKYPN